MNQYTPKSKPKNKKCWFDDIAKACGIREPQRGDIEKLATMYPDLKTEIETGHSYTLTIPLAQLTVICPRLFVMRGKLRSLLIQEGYSYENKKDKKTNRQY